MVGGGGGLRFADEPLLDLFVVAPFGREELQRDRAAELGVLRLVDDTHAATTELRGDLVMGNGLPDQRVDGRLVGHT